MMTNKVKWFSIASTFIGTLVGAGFASGQELLQFFANFGLQGLLGIILSTTLFIIIGFMIMQSAYQMNTSAYEEVAVPNVKILRWLVNGVITFFLFGILVVMFAGAGSLFNQLFNQNVMTGSLIMMLIVMIVALFSSERLIDSLSILVPIMVVIAVFCGFLGVFNRTDSFLINISIEPKSNWLLNALLFVSYNMVAAIAVLVPLGKNAHTKRDIMYGAFAGGAVLGVIAFILSLAIILNYSDVSSKDLPMMALVQNLNFWLGYAYAFVLFAGIFTTAAGCLYALLARINLVPGKLFKSSKRNVFVICVLSFVGSLVGFTRLVGAIYPVTGYLGFIIIFGINWNYFKSKEKSIKKQIVDGE
jgi:uncharacterized membrane protein YkvI